MEESRNLVILCDGTSNEIQGNLTNVLKIFRIIKKNSKQIFYYNPGVGTAGLSNDWTFITKRFEVFLGLAT